MQDKRRQAWLIEQIRKARTGAIPEDEFQALILEVVEADRQLNRSKGGLAKGRVSKGNKVLRQLFLEMFLIDELPPWMQQHLSANTTLDRLAELMSQHGYKRLTRETLMKDVKAIRRRERLRSPDTLA